MDDEWSDLGDSLEGTGKKQSKSHAGSSPNPVSSPTEPMEGLESSSTMKISDNTPFVDLTLSGSSSPFNFESASATEIPDDTTIIDLTLSRTGSSSTLSTAASEDTAMGDHFASDGTVATEGESNNSTADIGDSISVLCTVKFSKELYYLDIQKSWVIDDLSFELTQDPVHWSMFCHRMLLNDCTLTPVQYIKHCLKSMCSETGNCRDILGALIFAWFYKDEDNHFRFWRILWDIALDMIDFENYLGQSISYLVRIELPGGLIKGSWNHDLQEALTNKGCWGEYTYFVVDEDRGFRLLKWTEEEQANVMNNCSFAEDWVIELPRNEYYC